MFYEQEVRYRKLSVILSGFIINFIPLLYINCVNVIRHLDDVHRGDRMLVNNDHMRLNVLTNVVFVG
jgi:hypothetical protein